MDEQDPDPARDWPDWLEGLVKAAAALLLENSYRGICQGLREGAAAAP